MVYATHTLAGHMPAPGTVYGSLVSHFPAAAHTTVRPDGTVGDLGGIRITAVTSNDGDGDGDSDSDEEGAGGGITHVVALFHRRTPGMTSHEGYIRRKQAFTLSLTALHSAIVAGWVPAGGIVFPSRTGCGGSGCRWEDYRPLIDTFSLSLPDGYRVLVATKTP